MGISTINVTNKRLIKYESKTWESAKKTNKKGRVQLHLWVEEIYCIISRGMLMHSKLDQGGITNRGRDLIWEKGLQISSRTTIWCTTTIAHF